MVRVIKNVTNRFDKRKVDQEIKRNCKGLDEIERYFILTASQNKDKYNEVFEFFNNEWIAQSKRIVKTKKWVYTIPDQDYFNNKYGSLKKNFDKMFNVETKNK